MRSWVDWTGYPFSAHKRTRSDGEENYKKKRLLNIWPQYPTSVLFLLLNCSEICEVHLSRKERIRSAPSSPCLWPPLLNRSERIQNNVFHPSNITQSACVRHFHYAPSKYRFQLWIQLQTFCRGFSHTLIPPRCLDSGCSTAAR
jgi:hypothetical protein